MKRSAAILGPTPPFLRWTIVVPCRFRDPEAKNQANAAFRELRSLRAVAVGEIEGRIADGFCIHPDAPAGKAQEAKGFPVAEVYAAYGGKENAEAACESCPANVPISSGELVGSTEHSKAGCFGWVPFGKSDLSSPGFMRLMECNERDGGLHSIVGKFETSFQEVATRQPEFSSESISRTTPAWFGAWASKTFSSEKLNFLNEVCGNVECDSISWQRLARAVRVCCEHPTLELHVELTPAGFSDGKLWKIEASCATCGVTSPSAPCQVCGSAAAPLRPRKTKVLGLRPYLNLASIVGGEKTKQLIGGSE